MPSQHKAKAGEDLEPAPAPAQEPCAFRRPAAIATFLVVTVAALAADLASKHAVFEALLREPTIPERIDRLRKMYGADLTSHDALRQLQIQQQVAPGIDFTLSTNRGIVFGWYLPPWSVLIATVLTIGLVGYFFATSDARARTAHVALAMILAGALGNLYDRMFSAVALPGMEPITKEVRDFIDCSRIEVGGVNYPWIFNVADIWLVVGVALLVLYWWFGKHPITPAKQRGH